MAFISHCQVQVSKPFGTQNCLQGVKERKRFKLCRNVEMITETTTGASNTIQDEPTLPLPPGKWNCGLRSQTELGVEFFTDSALARRRHTIKKKRLPRWMVFFRAGGGAMVVVTYRLDEWERIRSAFVSVRSVRWFFLYMNVEAQSHILR